MEKESQKNEQVHKGDNSSMPDFVDTSKKSKSEISKMIRNRREKNYEEKTL
jgi:hypothetical protein